MKIKKIMKYLFILNNSYFITKEDIVKYLYYGPISSLIIFLIRFNIDTINIIKLKYFSKNDKI